jgi:PAS domain S-box-containing protein
MLGEFKHEALLVDNDERTIAVYDDRARLVAVYGDREHAERVTGFDATRALGKGPDHVAPPLVAEQLVALVQRVIATGKSESLDRDIELHERKLHYKGEFSRLLTSDGPFVVLTLSEIEEQQSQQTAADKTGERYRQMIEQAADLFVEIDSRGRVVYVSSNALRILGLPAENLHGVSPAERIHPDDQGTMRSWIGDLVRDGSPEVITVRFQHGDGRWIWLESSGRRYNGSRGVHVAMLARDVTQRVLAERRLADSNRRHRLLANSAFPLVVEISESGLTRSISPRLAARIGQPVEKLLGAELGAFVHPADTPRALRVFRRILDGVPIEPYMLRFTDGRGAWWYAELMGSVLSSGEDENQIMFFGRDITDELAEQERQRARDNQLWSSERAESVALVARGVAHDLNNLLSISLGIADLLRDELQAESASRQRIDDIISASSSAAALSRQLAAVTRTGELAQFETLDLVETIRSLKPLLRAAMNPGIRMHFDLGRAPRWVDADPSQISQLLVNLVRNAAESIDGGRGVVAIDIHEARTTADDELRVALSVKDTGSEIDPSALNRIFDVGFEAEREGRGVDLTVARRIVDGHGGEIRAELPEGGGTRIVVELPLLDRAPTLEPRAPSTQALAAITSASGKILVVDDDIGIRKVVSQALGRAGFETTQANNAKDALELLDRESDLVCALVDVILPGTSGVELAQQISERRPTLPVLWMTGDPELLPAEASRESWIRKPFRLAKLLERIKETIAEAPPTTDQGAI